jgi:hypothetical protein
MIPLRDRLLLVITALGLVAVVLGGGFALSAIGTADHLRIVWPYTVLLFVALLATAFSEVKRRSAKLHRKWPLIAAVGAFLIGHIVVVGWLVDRIGREWRGVQFYLLSIVEVILFGVVFESAYGWSRTTGTRLKRQR